jgi:hypothetical protein
MCPSVSDTGPWYKCAIALHDAVRRAPRTEARRDERQHVRIRVPYVVGRGRILSTGEQCSRAVKERLPAGYDELVADVTEKAPWIWGRADHQDN